MSSRRALPVILSPRARADYSDILRYTGETWGEAQVEIYDKKIDDALETIGKNFDLGHSRDDLPPPHLVYPVGSHVIIYRAIPNKAKAEAIGVVRILHQRMHLVSHVPKR